MNRISSIVYSSLRNYRTGRGGRASTRRAAASPRLGEITMPDSEIFSKQFGVIDYDDPDDIDALDSDFQNVGQYDKMHEREMQIKKDKLMTQIVKRKYFKCEDPPMLTWAEKEQIRLLHVQDPEEWSPDRLSESFPATRETVLKVLRSKWSPKNIKTVTKYDETTQKNWDLYRQGKLVVSAELRARLEKFKDRKIKPMDVEEIEKKIIKQKPIFPKPKSTLFSDIIKSNRNPDALDDCESDNNIAAIQIESGVKKMPKEHRTRGESMTFNEFLKTRVSNVQTCDETTPVDRVLVDEYKSRMAEEYKAKSLILESESPVGISKEMEKMNISKVQTKNEKTKDSKDISLILQSESPVGLLKKNKNVSTIEKMEKKNLTLDNERNSIETGIIAREKKIDYLDSDYPEYIKIPSKKFKPGVTYRVEDRYYDDDGEFLYRVPGLKS